MADGGIGATTMGGSAANKQNEWRAPGAMRWNGGKTSGAYPNSPMRAANPQGNAYGFRGTRPPQAQNQPQIEDPAMPAYDPTKDTSFSNPSPQMPQMPTPPQYSQGWAFNGPPALLGNGAIAGNGQPSGSSALPEWLKQAMMNARGM
ncbi:MAG: hypothetical protein ACR2IL_06355 [Chitinophagaceae bacterium]